MINSYEMVQKIKTICKENGIKISDLENIVGLSTGNLSRWSKSCPASIEVLYKIANELNVSADYLLGIENIGSRSSSISKNNKQDTIKIVIEKTRNNEIIWSKIPYSKSKKIQVIDVNEIIYNNNIRAYETKFNDYQLIFIHDISKKTYNLYIESNNEYLLASNDVVLQILYKSIVEATNNILVNFFNM